ncbi:aminoglycoside phosphotransferase family protein [soil metagenome]
MELQPTFVNNIHDVYGDAGKLWLAQLPTHIDTLSKYWNFRFIDQVPRLTYSFVSLVQINDSDEIVILKIAPDAERILAEAHWLQSFKKGVPNIYAVDKEKNAFLLEYLQPGQSLKSLVKIGQDETATRIICQAILALQSEQQNNFHFKHLSELGKDLVHLKGHLDHHSLSKVQSLFTSLTADRSHDLLLHGDLHHDNILSHNSTWKVIDPHGYIGDPVAEVGAMLRNPTDSFPTDHPLSSIIETRLRILVEELPFDAQRIKAWAYCMTMLSAAWNIEDFGTDAKFEIEIATAIDQVKL